MTVYETYMKYRKEGLTDKEAVKKVCKEFKISKKDVEVILNI